MEYYSVLKKKEILPFVTTWIKLKGTMLSEISQTQKETYCVISYVESKIVKLMEAESWMVVARDWGEGKMGR